MDYWTQIMRDAEYPEKNKRQMMKKKGVQDDPFSLYFPFQRRFDLGAHYPDLYFTRREAQSVYYLCQGMTMRETSAMMQLSPRTVEFYLGNVKEKMACNRKQLLLEKLKATPLWLMFHHGEHCQ